MDDGHARSQNKPADVAVFEARENAWFDHYLKGAGAGAGLERRGADDHLRRRPPAGPYTAASWKELAPGEIRLDSAAAQTILPGAGDPTISQKFDPIAGEGACASASGADQAGAANYRLPAAPAGGFTLLGSPTVVADISAPGGQSELAARLLDVAPGGTETLVARGLLRPGEGGKKMVFQLHPQGYHFAAGDVAKLELLPSDPPYARPSNLQAPIEVSNLELRLPVLEAPGLARRPGAGAGARRSCRPATSPRSTTRHRAKPNRAGEEKRAENRWRERPRRKTAAGQAAAKAAPTVVGRESPAWPAGGSPRPRRRCDCDSTAPARAPCTGTLSVRPAASEIAGGSYSIPAGADEAPATAPQRRRPQIRRAHHHGRRAARSRLHLRLQRRRARDALRADPADSPSALGSDRHIAPSPPPGSNLQPPLYKSGALPVELGGHVAEYRRHGRAAVRAIDARFRFLQPDEGGGAQPRRSGSPTGRATTSRWVYDEAEVGARLEAGTYVSCVAETPEGELLCHEGMSLAAADDAVGHSGQAVTMPAARGQHLFTRTKRFLMDWAQEAGMAGMFSEATAAHPYSQKANVDLGAHETGFLLGWIPATVSNDAERRQRAAPQAPVGGALLHEAERRPRARRPTRRSATARSSPARWSSASCAATLAARRQESSWPSAPSSTSRSTPTTTWP